MPEQFPVFIPVRDRLSGLQRLVAWLEAAGQEEIWFVDNQSTYPPLLDFLERTRHHVVRLPCNLGHRSPFLTGTVQRNAFGRFFIVSDPDIVPDEACPLDAIEHFRMLFDRYPEADKVGFALRIDDLPATYALRSEVVRWEQQFWCDEAEPGVFQAGIDSTFALYRPLTPSYSFSGSLRTGAPYVARHLSWYVDSAGPDPEERYYRAHADPTISNWNRDLISSWKRRRMANGLTELTIDS